MGLATRLVIGLSLVVTLVMSVYGVTSVRQREHLVGDALARETETVAAALQGVANGALAEGRLAELDRVLERLSRDPEVAVAAAVDGEGRVLAGRPRAIPACVASLWERAPGPSELHVWTECGGRARLVVLPLRPPASALVLARGAQLLERDAAASRRRILLTTLALAALASAAIVGVVRLGLTRPLSGILAGVRRLGGPLPPEPIPVPSAARELRELAAAFNEMVERLEGKRRTLVREAEERIELERRLRRAETFAALGRLTGGVAHELGSPLGVIGVRAEAIQADPAAPPAARRHAEAISAEVERVARLVRDLLHVARRHGPASAPVDLAALVRALADELRAGAARDGIELSLSLPGAPVEVSGDATLLRLALLNVASNAVQALRGHAGARRVEVSLARSDGRARVTVEDTGPGASPEDLPHLLEPFFTTKDVGEGSGLGLAISAGIAEEHGGSLSLAPAEAGGLRVSLDLPLASPSPEARP